MEGVWASAKACMQTYLLLAEKAHQFRADPRVQEAMEYAGISSLSEPTLDEGESLTAFLEDIGGFDADKAAERDFGYVALNQLAIEHLVG